MLTVRSWIALRAQGNVMDDNSLAFKTHKLVLISNNLLLWIMGLLHWREWGRRLEMPTGLGMIENIPLQCLYDVHKDNYNFNFNARSCYHIVFHNMYGTDVILTGLI
jgi:hypothetical protein